VKKYDKIEQLIGKRIRELRIKAGYTSQENFAYEADIPRAQYGRYESGSNITIKSLYKILIFHKISLGEFFEGL
jgi:transcriptional regulator with XRE-family HTH domain